MFSPQYTCSATSRISWLVDPRRVLVEGCVGDVTSAISIHWAWGHLLVCLSRSFLCIVATLWSRQSIMKSLHSWWWVVLQPWCSVLSSSRYSWPQRALTATLFEQPVLRVSCFAHLPKVVKLPHCNVTYSSILQYYKMCVIDILIKNWESDLDPCLLKLMLGNTNPYLKALMAKCELPHQIPALLSIAINTKPYNGLSKQGICNKRCQPNKQTPLYSFHEA